MPAQAVVADEAPLQGRQQQRGGDDEKRDVAPGMGCGFALFMLVVVGDIVRGEAEEAGGSGVRMIDYDAVLVQWMRVGGCAGDGIADGCLVGGVGGGVVCVVIRGVVSLRTGPAWCEF